MNGLDRKLIIIAGATRSGTTSLFEYLSNHPEIGAASRKETRFFLDQEYPGRSEFRYEAGIEAYWEYFQGVSQGCSHILEATSDYMFAPGVPRRILSMVGYPHLVFILRDPVERFVSWYRYAQQGAMIPSGASLLDYIEMQAMDEGATDQHKRVLEQGHYQRYLRRFNQHFPPKRMHVIFLEDMAEDPFGCLSELLESMQIESSALRVEKFERINRSFAVKSPFMHRMYLQAGFVLRTKLRRYPTAQRFVRGLNRRLVAPVYGKFNRRGGGALEAEARSQGENDPAIRYLCEYYSDVADEIREIIGRRPNWNSGQDLS